VNRVPATRSSRIRRTPGSASAALLVQAGVAVLAAIVLAVVAARAAASPRSAAGILHVVGAVAFLLGIAPTVLLGLGSFFLMFLVGESVKVPATAPAEYAGGIVTTAVLGVYSLLATWLLVLGLPRAGGNAWIALAQTAALLLTAFGALLLEPNKLAALQVLEAAIVCGACSFGGLALAGWNGRPAAMGATAGR
jgi:hypothetical protein